MSVFNIENLDIKSSLFVKEILHVLIENGLLIPDITDPDYCLISTDFLNALEEMGGGKRNERQQPVGEVIPRFSAAP